LGSPLLAYLDRIALVRGPATVRQEEGTLREFATFIAGRDPPCEHSLMFT
jgi:hypothetical protein